jgi:predicted ATPase
MITRMQINDFRCLKNVDVPLKPLTVLIGPNDSGKTTFLNAIAETSEVYPSNIFVTDPIREEPAVTLSLLDTGIVRLRQQVNSTGFGVSRSNTPMSLQHLPWTVEPSPHRLCLPDSIVSGRIHTDPLIRFMARDGGGLCGLVHAYLCQDRPRFDLFVQHMREFLPSIDDVHIAFEGDAKAALTFRVDGKPLHMSEMSTGVRLLAFYVAIALYPNPARPMLVEEPENGVHYKRLQEIIALFRSIVLGRDGVAPSQVILTTHSPYLLDLIDPEKDQVLVFKREEDGSRSVQPVDHGKWSELSKYFLLGEAWMNESESGLVGQATP